MELAAYGPSIRGCQRVLAQVPVDSSGGHAVLARVSYTNVAVSEPAAGTQAIPGTFSRTFFNV